MSKTQARTTWALIFAASMVASGCATQPMDDQGNLCSLAHLGDSDAEIRAPFEVVDGRVYVEARVNNQGPFRFAVDTGASDFARADSSLVAELGLPAAGTGSTSDGIQAAKVEKVQIDSLSLGKVTRTNLSVTTRDYSAHVSKEGYFHGIIARDFFGDGLLVIDYPRKTLVFSRAKGIEPTDSSAIPYERPFRVPMTIGSQAVTGNLDTGANVTFALPRSVYDSINASPLDEAGSARLTNTVVTTGISTIADPIRIGVITIADAQAKVSEKFPEIVVGSRVLSNYALLIDQRSKRIAICPQ